MNINIEALVEKLAHNSTVDELCINGDMDEEELYINGKYKKNVQKVFNRWYKYYYDIIIEHKID